MKKVVVIVVLFFVMSINSVLAKSGCCSWHGGVAGCNADGRQICNDGTLSPSCRCTPTYVYGCTDRSAKNYNSSANKDDGNCVYYKYGCTDINSINYDEAAEKDDGSCIPIIYGCKDSTAKNYNPEANVDDGTCIQFIYGCMDSTAKNYNEQANTDDGTCTYDVEEDNNENMNNDESTDVVGGIMFLQYIVGHVSGLGYCILRKLKK